MSKILLTADWHLGTNIGNIPILKYQEYVLKDLIQKAIDKKVEWFIIAGDIYDKKRPSEEEINTLERLLEQLYQNGINLIIVSGNHDGKILTTYSNLINNANSKSKVFLIDKHDLNSLQKIEPIEITSINGWHLCALPYVNYAFCHGILKDNGINIHSTDNLNPLEKFIQTWIGNTDAEKLRKTILITHILPRNLASNAEGALETVGQMLPVNEDILKSIGYVFSGHLHRKYEKGNLFFPGAPYHLSVHDTYKPKAWIIHLNGENIDKEPIDTLPIFEEVKAKELGEKKDLKKNLIYLIDICDESDEDINKAIRVLSENGIEYLLVSSQSGQSKGLKTKSNSTSALQSAQRISKLNPLDLITQFLEKHCDCELSEKELKIIMEALKNEQS